MMNKESEWQLCDTFVAEMRKQEFGASADSFPCFSLLAPDESTNILMDTSFRLDHHSTRFLLLGWEW